MDGYEHLTVGFEGSLDVPDEPILSEPVWHGARREAEAGPLTPSETPSGSLSIADRMEVSRILREALL